LPIIFKTPTYLLEQLHFSVPSVDAFVHTYQRITVSPSIIPSVFHSD